MSDERNKIEKFLELFHPAVAKNCVIVDPNELPLKHLLHISTNDKIKLFSPSFSRRLAETEDRRIPRVSTSLNLFGCVVGYQGIVYDFLHHKPSDEKDRGFIYKGGYYIYEFENEWSVRPNSKLVFDVNYSNEHWLLNFDRDHVNYKAKVIGQLFVKSLTIEPKYKDSRERGNARFYLKCDKDLYWTSKVTLTKGFYQITGPVMCDDFNKLGRDPFTVTSLTKEEFDKVKSETVALLSDNVVSSITQRWTSK